ncbi:MAG: hypothetical protein FWE03_05095 [Firmicutes bacterium]|nr:hypothetical protein [Bacillota bacterium]
MFGVNNSISAQELCNVKSSQMGAVNLAPILKREVLEFNEKTGFASYIYYVDVVVENNQVVQGKVRPQFAKKDYKKLSDMYANGDLRLVMDVEEKTNEITGNMSEVAIYHAVGYDVDGVLQKIKMVAYNRNYNALLEKLFSFKKYDYDCSFSNGNYSVYNDGGQWIAYKPIKNPNCSKRYNRHRPHEDVLKTLYLDGRRIGLDGKNLASYIMGRLETKYGVEGDDGFLVDEFIKRTNANIHKRYRRFRRKVNTNRFNYFVTFTNDPQKHTAKNFRKKLKRTISHFRSKWGWICAGAFEVSDDGFLHFHALIYVPKGKMRGTLLEKEIFCFRTQSRKTVYQNSFFLKTYGQNHFESIDNLRRELFNRIANYLLERVTIEDERIYYSHEILEKIEVSLRNKDIAMGFYDFGVKFIVFDDVFISGGHHKIKRKL